MNPSGEIKLNKGQGSLGDGPGGSGNHGATETREGATY